MDSFVFMRDVERFLLSQDLLKELRREFCKFVTGSINYHLHRVLPTHKEYFIAQAKWHLQYFRVYFRSGEYEWIMQILETKTPPQGAAKRFQNHLAFKLGNALVRANSPLKILKLPFTLGLIALSHKLYLDTLNTLYAQSPELRPKPLEIYSDHQEALKVKQTLSYKLGESMLKNPLLFVFKAFGIYREFNKNRKLI